MSEAAPSFDAVVCQAPVIAGTPADSARLRAFGVELVQRQEVSC